MNHDTENVVPAAHAPRERLTGRHWLYFTMITLVLLTDGMDVTIVSHVFPTLIKDWGVSVGGGIAFVVAVGFLAMGLGAIISGALSVRWGRKTILILSVVIFGSATALGGTSADFTQFVIWRLLGCVGMGAAMASGNTLLADLVPARSRAALLAAAYAGVGLGTTIGATLAGFLLPTVGWRALLIVGGVIPLVIIVVLAFVVPESPARRAVKLAGNIPVKVLAKDRVSVRSDLGKKFVTTTLLLWIFGFFSLGTQLLIAQYLPTLLQLPVPGLGTVQSSTIVGLYGFTSVLGSIVLGLLLVRGSRFTVIGGALCLAAVMALVVSMAREPSFGSLLVILGITGFILPSSFGPTRGVLAAMSFPESARGLGMGVTEFGGRLGSATGGVVGGTLIATGMGLSGIFLVLLLPIGVLLGALAGLRQQSRHFQAAEETFDGSNAAKPGPKRKTPLQSVGD
ncbi:MULTISPECIES: MFS transporter [Glutamicibacter]|uniref:MFS transporter n=1 Tax=Glutamicibacter soli TaxID=453836 RepID=A0A365YGC9_9MICC|nr:MULTISPECIES: MFS transporter [Glutamicibacter]QRQ78664.1 MFS transporter [Glutamicibacter protophormiae]RBM01063.1 MFS transporter [Glutamicibacter soli]